MVDRLMIDTARGDGDDGRREDLMKSDLHFSTTLSISSILTSPFLQLVPHWSNHTIKSFGIPSKVGRENQKSNSFIAQNHSWGQTKYLPDF